MFGRKVLEGEEREKMDGEVRLLRKKFLIFKYNYF